MRHDWSSAYLHQAFSDYKMFKLIESMEGVDDQKIYFLVKVGEKAAQSYWTDGKSPPKKDHRALLSFFNKIDSVMMQIRISKNMKYKKFLKKVEKVKDYAKELYKLLPEGFYNINCEYPWEDAGEKYVPAEATFSVLAPGNAKLLRNYIGLFETCFDANGFSATRREWIQRLPPGNRY